jgi:sugar lactone lactonase YvrE
MLYTVTAPYEPQQQAVKVADLSATWPVALAIDANGDVLVLDRVRSPDFGSARTQVITLAKHTMAATTKDLREKVAEPLSILVEPEGTLVVGDGGTQSLTEATTGNLVRVTRGEKKWTPKLLLSDAEPAKNVPPGQMDAKLVAPTGIVRGDDGQLYVIDAGLNPFAPPTGNRFVLAIAKHAVVYRVDPTGGTLESLTEKGNFVFPTGMAGTEQRLIVCDPGQPERIGGETDYARSRVAPFTFGLVIHFTNQTGDAAARKEIAASITRLADEQKPAHTVMLEVR